VVSQTGRADNRHREFWRAGNANGVAVGVARAGAFFSFERIKSRSMIRGCSTSDFPEIPGTDEMARRPAYLAGAEGSGVNAELTSRNQVCAVSPGA
jgi:hypothetical protein